MKYIIFSGVSLFLLSLFGCKKQGMGEVVDIAVPIRVENALGQSLLDPETPGHFILENIRKYDLVNGKAKLYYKSNLDWAYGYSIKNSKEYNYSFITIVPNIESKESPTTTYIDWGNGDRDTLLCTMTRNDGGYRLTTDVWYNGAKVFSQSTGSYPITIVK